jgi:hypothetical protein
MCNPFLQPYLCHTPLRLGFIGREPETENPHNATSNANGTFSGHRRYLTTCLLGRVLGRSGTGLYRKGKLLA